MRLVIFFARSQVPRSSSRLSPRSLRGSRGPGEPRRSPGGDTTHSHGFISYNTLTIYASFQSLGLRPDGPYGPGPVYDLPGFHPDRRANGAFAVAAFDSTSMNIEHRDESGRPIFTAPGIRPRALLA